MTMTKTTLKPSLIQDNAYYKAFDYFNKELFGGSLPRPYLVLSRNNNIVGGYFSPNQWADEKGKKVHEIAINANLMHQEDLEVLFVTLIHEMVHLAQYVEGTAGRKAYHNQDFADKCKVRGLKTININEPDKEIGQSVTTELIPKGKAERAIINLPDDAIFPWLATQVIEESGDGDGNGNGGSGDGQQKKPGRRSKYTCVMCGLNAWAKPGASLKCGTCDKLMTETKP